MFIFFQVFILSEVVLNRPVMDALNKLKFNEKATSTCCFHFFFYSDIHKHFMVNSSWLKELIGFSFKAGMKNSYLLMVTGLNKQKKKIQE